MGHVGKEGALEAVGGFGLFPFAVELPCRAADAQRADKADKPESSGGVLLARFSCQTQRSGVKRQADASQQIALGRILMALQTAFFRVKSSQSAELGGFGTYQFKTLSVLVVKTFQRGFLPCVGPVARALGMQPGDAESGHGGSEIFGNQPYHVGWIDFYQALSIRRIQCAPFFGNPWIRRTFRIFPHKDSAVFRVPVAHVRDAGIQCFQLEPGQLFGIGVFSSLGPHQQKKEQQPPQQDKQQRDAERGPV